MSLVEDLFQSKLICPTCRTSAWVAGQNQKTCPRCGYVSKLGGRHINLLPEHLTDNNQREADYFDTMTEADRLAVEGYTLNKPYNYPRLTREEYLSCCEAIGRQAQDVAPSGSILFVFGGGGMEAHLSGLCGPRVVLADISIELLHQAERRFSHYGVEQPAAFVACDAERLPFADDSFDLVIAFEGIHHCLVPQASLIEIWRVGRKAFVVDNYECGLTNMLLSVGQSSVVEHSGLKPNRFTKSALLTMMQNAKVQNDEFRYYASIPPNLARRLGYYISRAAAVFLEKIGQTNKFMLATSKAGNK